MRSALNCKLLDDPVAPQEDKSLGLRLNSAPPSLPTTLGVRKDTRLHRSKRARPFVPGGASTWDRQGKQTLSPQHVNNLCRGRLPQNGIKSGSSPEQTVTQVTEVTVALSPQGWKQPHMSALLG